MGNFVILIGDPGLFKGCDKAHDQSWTNYIVPLQLAALKNLYQEQPGEVVHWVLYEPPYRKRWRDDSTITKKEKGQDDGYHLHSIRKVAARKVLAKGSSSYIDRIRKVAATKGIIYKGINKPEQFRDYLQSLGDGSITRVWYSGHASKDGLMLALGHNTTTCRAEAYEADMILVERIKKWASLKDKFILNPGSKNVSKFYGCYTEKFAKEWHKVFKVGGLLVQ